MVLSGSNLYGLNRYGGTGDNGTIFFEPLAGGNPTNLCSLNQTSGQYPIIGLTLSGSTLYGVTDGGGANNMGTIFSEPLAGGTPTVLASFSNSGANGYYPYSSLILNDSTLYGMTLNGGAKGYGTIFSEPVTGGSPTILYSFDKTHGANPFGSLTLNGSTLYGTTYGGGANNLGTIFSEPLAGGTPTILFSFDGTHGADPMVGLILSGDGFTCTGRHIRAEQSTQEQAQMMVTAPSSPSPWRAAPPPRYCPLPVQAAPILVQIPTAVCYSTARPCTGRPMGAAQTASGQFLP